MIVLNTKNFSLSQTLECGQIFRFEKIKENEYFLQTRDIVARVFQENEKLYIEATNENIDFWKNFFDLDTNYSEIMNFFTKDEKMKEIIKYGCGIHILRQDFEEMLISFIMSQNKQIPQIKQCINLFCEKYGEKITVFDKVFSTFPKLNFTPTLEGLKECKVGFRDKYILDAMEKYNEGFFDGIKILSEEEQREKLLKIKGIGEKVCNCILLFGLARTNKFPVDVWIKKTMQKLYFDDKETKNEIIMEKAKELFSPYQGFAQQYIYFAGIMKKI